MNDSARIVARGFIEVYFAKRVEPEEREQLIAN
jgi:hypothetical protein